jgi:hypothetical protein
MNYGTTANPAQGRQQQRVDNGEGGSNANVPPSYAEVVAGDNKIQNQN